MITSKHCVPCTSGTPVLTLDELTEYKKTLDPGWENSGNTLLWREFGFKNFQEALDFTNKVGALAESEGHHPNIYLHNWNKVKIELTTHKIKGLSENDVILATKIDQIQV
ncbi:MAG: 4a-hydroxytetrahydrobiopterin dehydratase [Weeksellaceae bacterium]